MGSEILTFRSHYSANFQPILDCFIPKFKLKYNSSESIKTDRVDTVVFNLHQIKQLIFLGHPLQVLHDGTNVAAPQDFLKVLLECEFRIKNDTLKFHLRTDFEPLAIKL